jgi:peroxiredoxin Q/BCP
MSKKTRKKSPKTGAAKAAAKPGKPAKTSAKAPAATNGKKAAKKAANKTAKATANKSGKATSKKNATAPAKASHKAPSKPLRKPAPAESARSAAPAPNAQVMTLPAIKPASTRAPPAKAAAPAQGPAGISEGADAPAFRLPRDGGDSVSLADFTGRNLVLFFYPRADTPGCTKEAIDFTRLSDAFAESQTAVVGVSADPQNAQEAFRDKYELAVPLVSDEQHEMLKAYGVWGEKSMYGRTFLGILRTTVLVGADGRIVKIWRNVKVDGHADEVLDAVRAL